MSISVALTVAQGKRIIAKGVVAARIYQQAYSGGSVLLIKGTTNAYIVEEIIGTSIDKLSFARGLTLPRGVPRRRPEGVPLGDVLIDQGRVDLHADIAEVVDGLGPSDLII